MHGQRERYVALPTPGGIDGGATAATSGRRGRMRAPMLRLAGLIYGGMIALAFGIAALGGHLPLPLAMTGKLYPALGAAVAMTAATLVFSAFGASRWDWVRNMEEAFRRVLGPLELREVIALALASGVSEEVLFRGAIQPALVHAAGGALGLVIGSVIFALAHFPPQRELWPWPIFALALGLFLGAVTLLSGNLLPAIGCHVAINAVNLRRITRAIDPSTAARIRGRAAQGGRGE